QSQGWKLCRCGLTKDVGRGRGIGLGAHRPIPAEDFRPGRQPAGGVGVEGPLPDFSRPHVHVAGLELPHRLTSRPPPHPTATTPPPSPTCAIKSAADRQANKLFFFPSPLPSYFPPPPLTRTDRVGNSRTQRILSAPSRHQASRCAQAGTLAESDVVP